MKILMLFNLKTVYKIKDMIFPMFDDVFTAKILGMWKKRGFTTPPMQGCSPSIEPVSQWIIPQKKTKWEVRGVEEILF